MTADLICRRYGVIVLEPKIAVTACRSFPHNVPFDREKGFCPSHFSLHTSQQFSFSPSDLSNSSWIDIFSSFSRSHGHQSFHSVHFCTTLDSGLEKGSSTSSVPMYLTGLMLAGLASPFFQHAIASPVDQIAHSIPASAQWADLARGPSTGAVASESGDEQAWQWWIDFMEDRGCSVEPIAAGCVAATTSDPDTSLRGRQVRSHPLGAPNNPCIEELHRQWPGDIADLTPEEYREFTEQNFDCLSSLPSSLARLRGRQLAGPPLGAASKPCMQEIEDRWPGNVAELPPEEYKKYQEATFDCLWTRSLPPSLPGLSGRQLASPPLDSPSKPCMQEINDRWPGDVADLSPDEYEEYIEATQNCLWARSVQSTAVVPEEIMKVSEVYPRRQNSALNAASHTTREVVEKDQNCPMLWWQALSDCLGQEVASSIVIGALRVGPAAAQGCVEETQQSWKGDLTTEQGTQSFVAAITDCFNRVPQA